MIFGNSSFLQNCHFQSNTPKSEGLTALSWYVLICLLFMFVAMQEFAVVPFLRRRQKFVGDEANKVEKNDNLKKSKWNMDEGNKDKVMGVGKRSEQLGKTFLSMEEVKSFVTQWTKLLW